jgi:single-stranded-DNA-specific exonuclease
MNPMELRDAIAKKRGMEGEALAAFVDPRYENLTPSGHLHDMDRAVATIMRHLDAGSKIAIYADYDADGIPGATVLWDFFKIINYENVIVYLPNRHTEGYGLHPDAVRGLGDSGVKLIITVDLGITGHAAIGIAHELDIQVVVTDHHEIVESAPVAAAVVNPKLPPLKGTCDPMICGAAVAWHVVRALLNHMRIEGDARVADIPDGWEKWLLDVVGIATLSDQVPLVGENRIFASFGLKVLQKTKRPGLLAIMKQARIMPGMLTEDDVVFTITPRLNAASRMSDPRRAFELLTTKDPVEADAIARELSDLVDKRKTQVASVMKSVHAKYEGKEMPDVLVIGDPKWNHGILGLIASKLCEEYGRTVFVWAADGAVIRGSCRTVGTASAVDLMKHASHVLTQFGGHDGAGGFTTDKVGIMQLQDALCEAFAHHKFAHIDPAKDIAHDIDAPLSVVTAPHIAALRQLAPFGQMNPRPQIRFSNVTLSAIKPFGKTGNHLTLSVSENRMTVDVIAFFTTVEDLDGLVVGSLCDVYGSLDHSVFMGRTQIRIRLDKILPAGM